MSGWTALVLAGSRPGRDNFAEANGVDLKALIPVGGVPMVRRVADTLLKSPEIGRLVILSQHPDRLAAALPADTEQAASGSTIAATIDAILADPATRFPLLVTTADHALLTPAMVADFSVGAAGADLAIGLVERRPLMATLPETRRTWIGFRGGAYSGANLFAFGSPAAAKAVRIWRDVEQDRKKGWRMVAALGPAVMLGSILRLRTLQQTLDQVGRRLGLTVRAVEMADPIAAVDVDKPADLALAERLLKDRA